jgi:hypothetical protein
MAGSVATNLHQGSRSELLADYLFSGWGPITPVRRQDDYGLDLFGGLAEQEGKRSVVKDYYVVQVKSTPEPWDFPDQESVKWLVEYPLPIFLSCVDKKKGVLSIYHVTPRFCCAIGALPKSLVLVPEDVDEGECTQWTGGERYSLSAPILRVCLGDFLDVDRLSDLRGVFRHWVRVDRANVELRSRGLLRFRMPGTYSVNSLPSNDWVEYGNAHPDNESLARAVSTLTEVVECVGGQLGRRGDQRAMLLAALLLDQLQGRGKEGTTGKLTRLSGELSISVSDRLNQLTGLTGYRHAGLDALASGFDTLPLVARFLQNESVPPSS